MQAERKLSHRKKRKETTPAEDRRPTFISSSNSVQVRTSASSCPEQPGSHSEKQSDSHYPNRTPFQHGARGVISAGQLIHPSIRSASITTTVLVARRVGGDAVVQLRLPTGRLTAETNAITITTSAWNRHARGERL